jgi:hypothetical protein
MSGIEKIKDILTNDSVKLKESLNVTMNTKNGILDPIEVKINRGFCLIEALTNNVSDLITVDQGYPSNEKSEVEFNSDLVVLKSSDYNNIIKILNGIK